MFFHYFKYTIKTMLRSKDTMFWSFIFPVALATFMFASFGNIYETTEKTNPVPVAIVEEETNEAFTTVLDSISEGDDKLLIPTSMKEKEATKALKDETVDGIIYVGTKVKLVIREESSNATILSMFLDRYVQTEETITSIMKNNPAGVPAALEALNEEISSCSEANKCNGNQDNLITYFYAVFAMSCLFAAFNGVDRIFHLQANQGSLGQRRGVAPTHKSIIILAEFIASHLLQFVIEIITFLYMWKVLGINFGEKILPVFLILYVGSACGIALGMLIGALPKPTSAAGKIGLTVSFTMTLSVMADLCAPGIKYFIEHNIPIINRINPAALITDAFYSLNIYDTYTRFFQNMAYLSVITILLCVISYIMIRRNRYASL